MNCQDKSLSQLHCQEVSVLLQPLWSTAIRVTFELSESFIVRRCLQCEQKVDKCNRPTFATAKSGLWFGPRIHEITDLTAKTRAEQNTAVFSIAHTSLNLVGYNAHDRDCLWLFVWLSIFLTRVFLSLTYDLLMRLSSEDHT